MSTKKLGFWRRLLTCKLFFHKRGPDKWFVLEQIGNDTWRYAGFYSECEKCGMHSLLWDYCPPRVWQGGPDVFLGKR